MCVALFAEKTKNCLLKFKLLPTKSIKVTQKLCNIFVHVSLWHTYHITKAV